MCVPSLGWTLNRRPVCRHSSVDVKDPTLSFVESGRAIMVVFFSLTFSCHNICFMVILPLLSRIFSQSWWRWWGCWSHQTSMVFSQSEWKWRECVSPQLNRIYHGCILFIDIFVSQYLFYGDFASSFQDLLSIIVEMMRILFPSNFHGLLSVSVKMMRVLFPSTQQNFLKMTVNMRLILVRSSSWMTTSLLW